MHRRSFAAAVTAFLCLMTYGLGRAATTATVWIALSDHGGAYSEAAEALRQDVEQAFPGRVDWRVAHWSQFAHPRPEPQWIVAVGTAAQRGMQDLFAQDQTPPPRLTILVPRVAFERIADPARVRAGSETAVFLDQSPARHLDLIRLALPDVRSVGVLVSADAAGQLATLERTARERGLQLVSAVVDPGGLYPALHSVLPDVGLLLALPDPVVFNSQTASGILMAAYRRRIPLAGFSPAYVKAGALLAVYSTPAQVGARGGELLRQALHGKGLAPPQPPREFSVTVNQNVAHSLGLVLDEARLAEQLRQKDRP